MPKRKIQTDKHADGTESDLERLFLHYWRSNYPLFLPENNYRFHPERQWRFDFAWPNHNFAVEVQGMGPGHTSLKGMTNDYDKQHAAMLLHWRIFYITTSHIQPLTARHTCNLIAQVLQIPIPVQTVGYVPFAKRNPF